MSAPRLGRVAPLPFPGRPGRPRRAEPRPARITTEATPAEPRRLFDLRGAAAYLGGVSPWTVRDLEAQGILRRVRIPLPHGGELRRVLFDRADLDRLIDAWKE